MKQENVMAICLRNRRSGFSVLAALSFLLFATAPAAGAALPKKGDTLAALEFETPGADTAKAYLGLTQPSFRLADLGCRLVLLEVIGVYCPQCYRQAPHFNSLFHRIEKSAYKGEIKMLALAAGGNTVEIQYLIDQKQYSFPIVADPSFRLHKALGEPRTPFTLLIDSKGKVLHTHMGIIENVDAFWNIITELLRRGE